MIGDEPANTDYDPDRSEKAHTARRRLVAFEVSSRDTSLKRPTIVGLVVKPIGKPNAGNRHVRFDERGWETERWPSAQATAPILNSTRSGAYFNQRVQGLSPCAPTK